MEDNKTKLLKRTGWLSQNCYFEHAQGEAACQATKNVPPLFCAWVLNRQNASWLVGPRGCLCSVVRWCCSRLHKIKTTFAFIDHFGWVKTWGWQVNLSECILLRFSVVFFCSHDKLGKKSIQFSHLQNWFDVSKYEKILALKSGSCHLICLEFWYISVYLIFFRPLRPVLYFGYEVPHEAQIGYPHDFFEI